MGRKCSRGFWLELVQVGCAGGWSWWPRRFQAALRCLMHHLSGFSSLPRAPFQIRKKLQAPEVILFISQNTNQPPFGLILIQDLPLPQNPPGGGEITG